MTQPEPTPADDMYERAYLDIQKVLDRAIGDSADEGEGAGIVADVQLVVRQRDEARAQAFRDAAQMIENSKPESTNPNLLRALDAYRAALAAGLRISAKLTESATEETP